MNQEQPQKVWDEYHQNIRNRRLVEVEIINKELKTEGIASDNPLVLDFKFFSNDKQGAENLKAQLSENYEITIEQDGDYWFIKGTTRPYVVNLDCSQHVAWVKFMHEVALSHRAIFSMWTVTEPKLGKSWSSDNIETEFD